MGFQFAEDDAKWRGYVQDIIDNEGFDYSFMDYSSFDNIADAKFHELRAAYVIAYKKLFEYIYGRDRDEV